ncbi:hypothetical protein [Pseudotabrizicola sp. 4114]|uniref:hypothetical protein n=1 Tax=Pseudotabrizicola sp. 4114 TaxID=2817731 RepID=UPI002867284C|nr:hypothetical protein [Pseudorhodobacter sp. 4114]
MDEQDEERIILGLTLRAKGGDVDAAKLLFAEKAKRVRPVRFQECQSLDELKIEFETYMGMDDITRAESEHAAKAFDRLFKLITVRDEAQKQAAAATMNISGLLLVPFTDPISWEAMAEKSQAALRVHARN